jgi:multiple sugar transport system permease protein
VTTALASAAAYGLVRMGTGRSRRVALVVLGSLILLQMIPQATAVTPVYALLVKFHLIDSLLGLIIVDSGLLVPFAVLVLRPHVMNVPFELEESARMDGAGTLNVALVVHRLLGRVHLRRDIPELTVAVPTQCDHS